MTQIKYLIIAVIYTLCTSASAASDFQRVSGFEMQQFVPGQASDDVAENDRKWSCGPNSGARALAMLPNGICVQFKPFMENTPATIGRTNTKFIMRVQSVLAGAALAVLIQRLEGWPALGYSLAVGLVISSPRSLAGIAPVGPHPAALAEYLQEWVDDYDVKDLYFDNFEQTLSVIRESVLDRDTPLIAHLCFGAFALHYVNIIGFSERLKQVEVLDTNGVVYRMRFDRLEQLMNTDVHILNPLVFGQYNLIIFKKLD